MRYDYPDNSVECSVTYVRNRIENNYFIVYYKNVARIRLTPKDVWRVFGVAKFTPGVNKIRDWCKEMVAKYESADNSSDTLNSGPVDKAGGVGPECHEDEDPTANTKMIV